MTALALTLRVDVCVVKAECEVEFSCVVADAASLAVCEPVPSETAKLRVIDFCQMHKNWSVPRVVEHFQGLRAVADCAQRPQVAARTVEVSAANP